MKAIFCTVLAAMALSACTSVPDVESSQRVDTELRAAAYNSLASSFLERPTFVTVVRLSDGDVLNVERSDYTSGSSNLSFTEEGAASARQIIDKYEEWREIALRDGDAFTKEIGRAASLMGSEMRLSFHSGSAEEHYLAAAICSGAMSVCAEENSIYFDAENVARLDALLAQFVAGEIEMTDYDSKYQ